MLARVLSVLALLAGVAWASVSWTASALATTNAHAARDERESFVPTPQGSTSSQAKRATNAADSVLTSLRAQLEEAQKAQSAGDHATARAVITHAIERAVTELRERDDSAASVLLEDMGRFAYGAGELRQAERALRAVLDKRSRTLPEDHPDLAWARGNLALTIKSLGDLVEARALEEKVLEVRSRTLPEDHPALTSARGNLAGTLYSLGDLAGARALFEAVLEVRSRTLPDDHPGLGAARGNLALTLKALGDLAGARALQEKVLEVYSRTLPADHLDLALARGNLALTLAALGDLAGARALQEKVLDVLARTLPEDHPDLGAERLNLAGTIKSLGDLAGARALEERVLEVRLRTLPDDHPDLGAARLNLADTIKSLGDLAGARALEEKAIEVLSRTLPEDHRTLAAARGSLAGTLHSLGDFAGARVLFEKVLEVFSRTRPEDHPDLAWARQNLAATLHRLGDLAGARALEEKVLEVRSRTLPADHEDLVTARQNLAVTIRALGDLAGAQALFENVLEVRLLTLPEDHPDVTWARGNLAWTLAFVAADALRDPAQQRTTLDAAALHRSQCTALLGAMCRAQMRATRTAVFSASVREAEARSEQTSDTVAAALSFAAGLGVFEPIPELDRAAFELGETTRGAALSSAALLRSAGGTPRYEALRTKLREQSGELAALVQRGTTSNALREALARREAIERELVALARELAGGDASFVDFDLDALASHLEDADAAIAYRRYERWSIDTHPAADASASAVLARRFVDSLCAFVVRDGAAGSTGQPREPELTRIELGPIAPIEDAVRAWRAALDVGAAVRGVSAVTNVPASVDADEAARTVRELLFDPLRSSLEGADHLVVALDDVLHLVALDALPLDEATRARSGPVLLGDRWRIETHCTLTELLRESRPGHRAEVLLALGGAAFDAVPLAPTATDPKSPHEPVHSAPRVAGILRGGAWTQGFDPLAHTGLEAREVAALHDEMVGEAAASVVLDERKASRASLESLAPQARWLHVATHGWFAPESIKSWNDDEPLDEHTGLGLAQSSEEQVKGMSPMLLCGLALAGANLPENEVGRAPGLITADELSTLDLSRCELAVLSACDTNVGVRRAGQGVASLQRALHMAGARSVITSLWKVPDEATRELMVDFYRRMWVEKKPKGVALWEAKMALREAKDESGQTRYSTRDWAAWVLTGNPD